MDLTSAPFLFLDGQTTGLSPRNAELIELGWSSSFDPQEIQTRLVRPSDVVAVPRIVWSMTGINAEELAQAEAPDVVWKTIVETSQPHAAIIHYSQFEMPFLLALHKQVFGEAAELPWPVICTYRVAKRLHDDLPARSLRALSGYFGLVLPERHRAQGHVEATQTIWRNLLTTLKEQEGIESWEAFLTWWQTPPAPTKKKASARKYLVKREKRLELTNEPGVYEMHAQDGQILYIGKATSLNSRVNSYFRQRKTTRTRLKELMTQVAEVRVTPTATPLEAALLENDRIKAIDPRYNYSLREHARRLLFVAPCLTHFSERRDEEHPWGPFTSHEVFESLERLLLIQRGEHDRIDPFLLNYPPEVTKEKLETFLQSIGIRDFSELSLPDLLRSGRFAPAEIPEETEDEALLAEASVYRKLRRTRRYLHQAHWLVWLTESRIYWPVAEKGFRVLVIRGGKLSEAFFQAEPPHPSTYVRSRVPLRDRQRRMDLVTYDRMRILGTELSIIAKRTPITVQYSSTRTFNRILSYTKGEAT